MATAPDLPLPRQAWIPEEIFKLPYFHPKITNSDAATAYIKKQYRNSGMFLLRQSSKGVNFLSLSIIVTGGQIHHVQVCVIKKVGGQMSYYIVPEIIFPSFELLQHYYSQHRIGNLEKVDNVKLLHPIVGRARTSSLPNMISLQDSHRADRRRQNFAGSRQKSEVLTTIHTNSELESHPAETKRVVFVNSPEQSDSVLKRRSRVSIDSEGNDNRNSGSSDEHQLGRSNSRVLSMNRPPQPLPARNSGSLNPYYSRTKDENLNRANELQDMLRSQERCDCGLLLADAELGYGWAVHKSRDTLTLGKLFFQDTEGETTWSLAETILCKLTDSKLDFLVKLYEESNQRIPFDGGKYKQLNAAMIF